MKAYWESKDSPPGEYLASATINYGGEEPEKVSHGFRVGDINIEILNISTELDKSIAKILIDVKSNWNSEITDVYAEIVVKNGSNEIDKIKTSAVDLEPWGRAQLVGYWDRAAIDKGEYELDIYVYYYDKFAQDFVKISLSDSNRGAPMGTNTILIAVVILLAFILIANLLFVFAHFSKKKKRK